MYKHKQSHGGKGDANNRVDHDKYSANLDKVDWGYVKSKVAKQEEAPKAKKKEVPLTWLV